MRIVVLAGGMSPERDVSLSSGSLIANALLANGHEVLLLDLYLGAAACPADGNPFLTAASLQDLAARVHATLRLGFYSRIDFLMDAANRFYCLEANTLPGMTPLSLLPQEAKTAGISYPELCEMIARSALR